MNKQIQYIDYFHSPIGILRLKASEKALVSIDFTNLQLSDLSNEPLIQNDVLELTKQELNEYFIGNLHQFTIPLEPNGTDFQKMVWNQLTKIEYGSAISYKELSIQLNSPKAIRAIGTANGANPIPIIIPCHRVIGSNRKLVGYRGELWRKEFLLQHEGILPPKLF